MYYEHYAALVDFARFYCVDTDEASSSVQQVFLNVWEKREVLLKQENIKPYLYTAVRNRVFNANRRKHIGLELDTDAEDDVASSHDILVAKELEQRIDEAINTLPDRCKYIFELSRRENLPHAEIATRLGLSIKTVENQIGKALKILRTKVYPANNQ